MLFLFMHSQRVIQKLSGHNWTVSAGCVTGQDFELPPLRRGVMQTGAYGQAVHTAAA